MLGLPAGIFEAVKPHFGFKKIGPNRLTLDTDKQVFFYEQEFYPLSNFSAFNVVWKNIVFDTSEHAYHWEKFNWNSEEAARVQHEIRGATSAHDAFKIAQENKQFQHPDWDNIKAQQMLDILRAKVAQHPYVKKKLLETMDREIIENSWRDDVWGWGPERDGLNLLGNLWMTVREEVRNS